MRFRGGGFGPAGTTIGAVVDNVVVSAGPATVVPEPAAWALLGSGLAVLLAMATRRRTRAAVATR